MPHCEYLQRLINSSIQRPIKQDDEYEQSPGEGRREGYPQRQIKRDEDEPFQVGRGPGGEVGEENREYHGSENSASSIQRSSLEFLGEGNDGTLPTMPPPPPDERGHAEERENPSASPNEGNPAARSPSTRCEDVAAAAGMNEREGDPRDPERPERAPRRSTRECREATCPNRGGRCREHGKLRFPCRADGCAKYSRIRGWLCKGHASANQTHAASARGEDDAAAAARETEGDPRDPEERPDLTYGGESIPVLLRFPCGAGGCARYSRIEGGLCIEHASDRPRTASGGDRPVGGYGRAKNNRGAGEGSAVEGRSPVAGMKRPPPPGPMNDDIILSMTDKRYKSNIKEECDGADTGNKNMWALDASRRVLETLKALGRFWIREPNSTKLRQVTEEEAFKRIRMDLLRHLSDRQRKSPKKDKGSDADRSTGGDDGKKRSGNEDGGDNTISSSKKRKDCHPGRTTQNSKAANFETNVPCGKTCHEFPMMYVGQHIFDLLKKDGWTFKRKKIGETNDTQVIYCPGCDKKNAVEGEDKFTGYPALAQWAYDIGYFEENVVVTVDGRAILAKCGILDDPYSIFEKKCGDPAQGESSKTASASFQNDDYRPTSRDGDNPAPEETSASVQNDDHWSNMDIVDNQAAGEETQSASGPTQINDEEWFHAFAAFDNKLAAARSVNDSAGMAFYGHLVHYLQAKCSREDFSLGSDKDIFTKSIESFEDMKANLAKAVEENRPTQNVYEIGLRRIINRLKEQLPLELYV